MRIISLTLNPYRPLVYAQRERKQGGVVLTPVFAFFRFRSTPLVIGNDTF